MSQDAFQKMQIVGIDDGSFKKEVTKKALLAAVLFKGLTIEDIRFTKVKVDGLDATARVAEVLNGWEFDAVMLAGVSFAGFNVVDPTILFDEFRKPLIIISRKKPNNKAVKQALLHHFKDWQIRWEVFQKLGIIYKVNMSAGEFPLYIEIVGGDLHWAKDIIKAMAVSGRVPEPIRVARLIARGLSSKRKNLNI
ncbi:MAG: DUF99 family protein [Nitrososphaerota archaeon]|nr:DUF99 family protein [Nitrososphaerota archaeon]